MAKTKSNPAPQEAEAEITDDILDPINEAPAEEPKDESQMTELEKLRAETEALRAQVEMERLKAEQAELKAEQAERKAASQLGYRVESDKEVVRKAIEQAIAEKKDPWTVKVSVRAALRTDTNDPNYWLCVNQRSMALPADDKYHELPLPFAECLVNTIHAARFVREYADKNIQVYDPYTNPHPNGEDVKNIRK